jgi:hypothetical protein
LNRNRKKVVGKALQIGRVEEDIGTCGKSLDFSDRPRFSERRRGAIYKFYSEIIGQLPGALHGNAYKV